MKLSITQLRQANHELKMAVRDERSTEVILRVMRHSSHRF